MKLRTFFGLVLLATLLAACSADITAPQTHAPDRPALEDGSGMLGGGGKADP